MSVATCGVTCGEACPGYRHSALKTRVNALKAHPGYLVTTCSPEPIAALQRSVTGRRALLVDGEEWRGGDALPQRGAVGGERLDTVGVDRKPQRRAERRRQPLHQRAA